MMEKKPIFGHDIENKEFFGKINDHTFKLFYRTTNDGKILDFHRTYVPEELRGQGLGEQLVKYALNYAKNKDLLVYPTCPFVQLILSRNPEYKFIISK